MAIAMADPLVLSSVRHACGGRYTGAVSADATDPGMVRAGAAFAAQRTKLGIVQRKLADQKLISGSSLIAFEKGRSWPRERTLAMLEDLVQWPAGTLARIRSGGAIPGDSPGAALGDGEASLIVDAVAVAMHTVDVAIAQLPADDQPGFAARVRTVLADLRRLEAVTVRAVRSSQGAPAVIRSLAAVRRRYDEVTTRAASAPGATLGQRLYTARRRANLSVDEAAAALGAPPELVIAVESESPPPDDSAVRIEALITDLEGY
jgi:transcriptional regulator with XRE-family HTH domain